MRVFNLILGLSAIGISTIFSQTKPNILFFFSDDHAYQSIGAYDGLLKDYARTPHLDKLASEGMRFEKAYVTNSICAPSRAVVQTGKYSHLNGIYNNGTSFNGSQQTFPKLMQAGGYQTAIVGKWHLSSEPQGFDYYEVTPGQGRYFQPQYRRIPNWGNNITYQGYNSDVIGDLAIDWLDNTRDQQQPFILMVQFKATHRSWMPPTRYVTQYDGETLPEPASLYDDFTDYDCRSSASFYSAMTLGDNFLGGGYDDKLSFSHSVFNPMTNAQMQVYQDGYAAQNAVFGTLNTDRERRAWWYQRYVTDILSTGKSIDDNVGRLMTYLDNNNLANNTVVIYTSDQGFYLGEHSWFDKRFMYEESFRTPLIVRWPGNVTPGMVNNDDIVSNLDYAETFLDLAGLTIPSDMQGASLVPVLKGQTPNDWRQSFYYQYYEGGGHGVYRHYGVTTGRYKLIYFHDVDEWEFYDLKKDPQEMINQYYITENDSLITAMKAELTRLRSDLGVPASTGSGPSRTRNFTPCTDPLPLKGCADPNANNYDPEVTDPDNTMCEYTSVRNKIKPDYFKLLYKKDIKSLKVEFNRGVVGNKSLKIFNVNGNEIFHYRNITSPDLTIDLKKYGPGIYMIKLIQNNLGTTQKLFI